jgi:hypothetical protein
MIFLLQSVPICNTHLLRGRALFFLSLCPSLFTFRGKPYTMSAWTTLKPPHPFIHLWIHPPSLPHSSRLPFPRLYFLHSSPQSNPRLIQLPFSFVQLTSLGFFGTCGLCAHICFYTFDLVLACRTTMT